MLPACISFSGYTMRNVIIFFFALIILPATAPAGVQEGLAAMKRGDYASALREFEALAEKGDSRAMITIGLWYHEGKGFPQDYDKAISWYLRAFELGNGDAYNNLGVMYRDGLGVEPNRSVSYALFSLALLRGLGSASTQRRAMSNLRREISETSERQRELALCMTESYLENLVASGGELQGVAEADLPSPANPRIKDNRDLWLESERQAMSFDCPDPWN